MYIHTNIIENDVDSSHCFKAVNDIVLKPS